MKDSFTLWANTADDQLMVFFLCFPKNRIRLLMQTVSNLHELSNPVSGKNGDNLHEMSNPVFWKK